MLSLSLTLLAMVVLGGPVSPWSQAGRGVFAAEPARDKVDAKNFDASKKPDGTSGKADDGKADAAPPAPAVAKIVLRGIVVDEADAPAANVNVTVLKWNATAMGQSVEDGQFRIEVEKSGLRGATIVASDDNGRRQGLAFLRYDLDENAPPPQVRITLRKARNIPVIVTDKSGKPVRGAQVFAIQSFKRTAVAETGDNGEAVLRTPADTPLECVYAAFPGAGVDYCLFHTGSEPANDPYKMSQDHPGPINLTLGNARIVHVRVVNEQSKPLPGVTVYPWLFDRPKKGGQFNTGGAFLVTTDKAGIATFDMIPADNQAKITFWANAEGYFSAERSVFDPAGPADDVTAVLLPLVPIRGTAIYADGRPAAGAEISVVGAGHQFDDFRGNTKCAEDGTFEIRVKSDQYCVFVAASGKFASPAAMRIVRAGKPVEPVALVLQPATRVHGKVTIGENHRPVVGQYITLYLKDGYNYYELPEEARLPNPKDSRKGIVPILTRTTQTDKAGGFEFFAGPGKYYVIGPNAVKPPEFSLTDEGEHEVNLHAERADSGEIVGRVVLADNPEHGVPEAIVSGVPTNFRGRYLQAVTNNLGGFRTTRGLTEMFVHARTEDGLLSGITQITADDTEVVIPVRPTASARGRLVDKETGHPLADQQIDYGMRIDNEGGSFSWNFGGSTTTNALGEFTLGGLTVGRTFQLNAVTERDVEGWARSSRTIGAVAAESSDPVAMADIKVETSNPAPTLEYRIGLSMPQKPLAADRLRSKLREAQLAEQRVLVVAAARASDSCQRFFEMYFGDGGSPTIIRKTLANFSLFALDTSEGEFRDAAGLLLGRLKLELPAGQESLFAVLDAEGRLVAAATAEELSIGNQLNGPKLFAFLKKHVQPQPDAEKLLADALVHAKRDNKRVLVLQRAPLSAPCLLLSRFLDRHAELLAKDYIVVTLDVRYANGPAVIKRVRKQPEGGLPWMAVLDADGTALITSTGPDGNSGFSLGAAGVAHFDKMLRTTARRLTSDDVQLLTKSMLGSQ